MVRILHLYPDMTFKEEEKKTKENRVELSKTCSPSFVEGQAIFREKTPPAYKFWKRRRNLGIFLDGTLRLWSMDKEIIHSEFGTLEDIQKYIAGEIAKTKSKQKPMELWQLIIIIAMLVIVIVLELKIVGVLNF